MLPLLLGFTSLVAGENCPAPADVERRVRTILHLSAEQALSEQFSVERHEAGLYVALQSADGAPIGERTLPAEGSCEELAQAAAVVLSAWLSDVHPDFAGALPEPASEPSEGAPAAESASAPQVPPPLPPPPPVPPAPPPRPVLPPVPRTRPYRVDLALAVGVGASDGEAALAGQLEAGWLPGVNGLGVSALVLVDATRRASLGSGAVAWRRWPLAIGPTLRLRTGLIAWDLSLAPSLTWLRLTGDQFDLNFARQGFTVGGFAQLRASTSGPRWGALLAVNSQIYPGHTDAYAGPLSYTLPVATVTAFVGVRWSP